MARAPFPFGRRLGARLTHAALIGCAVLLAAATVTAQEVEANYRVSDVEVEATAQDAVAARALAIDQGQRRALDRLLQRLTDGPGVASLDDVPVEDLVSSIEVIEEQVGPSSYQAVLEVAFERAAVEELLDTRGVAYADVAADPVVLVPLWETGSGLRLWESDNSWKSAWDRALDTDALVPFVVPLGDLQDLALLNPDQAARGDAAALQALAERYGTDDVVVAGLQGSGEPGTRLEISARRYGDEGGQPYRAVVRRQGGETLAASLQRAAAEMQAAFDARFRERRVATAGPRRSLVVSTPVEGLDRWGRLLRTLDGLSEVQSTEVLRFSQREAELELRVAGDVEALRRRLGEAGWTLSGGEGDRYRLERGAGGGMSAL